MSPASAAAAPPRVDNRILYEIIRTVGSTLDLDRVLGGIVGTLSQAVSCRACFAYLDDGSGGLVLRAASEQYGRLVGRLAFGPGEGMVGWVHQNRAPVFLRDNALADPRMKYVPELEEERFQSFVAVPLLAHDGESLGALSLHTEAPREFTDDDSEFLAHVASLVAGAVENARLYDAARRRVGVLEALSRLGATVSRAETLDELLPAVVQRAASLLEAERCQLYLLEPVEGRLRLRASAPPAGDAPSLVELHGAGATHGDTSEPAAVLNAALFGRSGDEGGVLCPLVATGELLGFLVATAPGHRALSDEDRDLARTVASQTAVAIKKIQLIERLTERNVIKDFLEDLSRGAVDGLSSRAARIGVDLGRPHLVLLAHRAPPPVGAGRSADELERLEHGLVRLAPGALCDRRDDGLRGLLPLAGAAETDLVERLRAVREAAAPATVIGLSSACAGVAAFPTGFEEARQAVRAAPVIRETPAVIAFDDLGPYKYLLRVSQEGRVRDRHADALRRLLDYDRKRQAQLVRTLEEYLRQRGNVSATAQALYVHPNTLRQRLRRIGELTELDVRTDDWLMIEIALKLLRLEDALAR